MTHAEYRIGDVYDRMAEIPDGTVDLIMCSPPFLALRSYLPADHPDKAKEIGSEPTPAAFIDTLLALTSEWRRILAPHGSICIELGDTYAGSGGSGGDYNVDGLREGAPAFDGTARRMRPAKASADTGGAEYERRNKGDGMVAVSGGTGWPLAKSLCLIPELYRVALVYGLNPLTGQPSNAGRWRARNVVRWHRPNPPVGALGDKFRPATSDMVIACMSAKRYFDLDAVREPLKPGSELPRSYAAGSKTDQVNGRAKVNNNNGQMSNPAGAPPLDTWVIPTEPYKGSHYATWPRDLCTRPILAMCPQHVCNECGKPRERITEQTDEYAAFRTEVNNGQRRRGNYDTHLTNDDLGHRRGYGFTEDDSIARGEKTRTVGWSDCGHNNFRRGLVLDPFAGTGTTLAVATGHGRDAIGIDIDIRNAALALERVGMFLTVDYGKEAVA